MSLLVRKELRMLAPPWMAAMVVATSPLWPINFGRPLGPWFYFPAVLVLCLWPFGQETGNGTFGLLLAQPVERRRVWWTKTGLLAAALLSVTLCLLFCLSPSERSRAMEYQGIVIMLAIFSGSLWSSLLLRDFIASLACAVIAPMIVFTLVLLTVGHWINPDKERARFDPILYSVLAAYSVAGFFWAYRLFLRAEDMPWTGGQIFLKPGRGFSLRRLGLGFGTRKEAWLAVALKELQMQEVPLLLAPVLFVLHWFAVAASHAAWSGADGKFLVDVVPIIWLVAIPCLIGCVAVAEERRFNTLESLLCAPIGKKTAYAIKLLTALALGTIIGGIPAWALAWVSGSKLFDLDYVLAIAPTVTAVAFYSSSLSRGLLQALVATLLVPAPFFGGLGILNYGRYHSDGRVVQAMNGCTLLFWPIALTAVFWLAFRNFKQARITGRNYLFNFLCLASVIGVFALVSCAIYDRSWEWFERTEARHGPAQIFGDGRAVIAPNGDGVTILLPDGRIWRGNWKRKMSYDKKHSFWGQFEITVSHGLNGQFLDSSHKWTKLLSGLRHPIALRDDGTLWTFADPGIIKQIGSDSDWTEVASEGNRIFAVKQNGTLWARNIMLPTPRTPAHPEEKKNAPFTVKIKARAMTNFIQIGADSNWANVFGLQNNYVAGVKQDGSVWLWKEDAQPSPWENVPAANWTSIVGGNFYTLGLRADGSLWAWSKFITSDRSVFGNKMPHDSTIPAKVGTKSDWNDIEGSWSFCGIEGDGRLRVMSAPQREQPSRNRDWLACARFPDDIWALSKDGTLACWPGDETEFGTRFGSVKLGPSHRPVLQQNILTGKP